MPDARTGVLEDLIEERKKKLALIRKAGINPYPAKTAHPVPIAEVLEKFSELSESGEKVVVAGRIFGLRDQGGLVFLDIKDRSGKIQAVLKKDNLKDFDFMKSVLDRGDFVSLSGTLFKTKSGERSVEAVELQILAKSLRPIPSEWYGIEEAETRLRQRYLDILLNEEVRNIFLKKAIFWDTIRNYLKKEGFLEVETPVFETIPGGADAEPFKAHYNALDMDFYLRISLELPLKKLLVAGFEKVFEIGRIFRNEGIDREHLQDYTQMEFYWAYRDYNDLMPFVQKMYKETIESVTGSLVTKFRGEKIYWGEEWPKIEYVKIFEKENKINPLNASRDELFDKAKSLGLSPDKNLGKGRLIDLIFKKTVRPKLIQPAFLVDPPVELVPLAKRSEKDPRIVERVQPVACGLELGNGFSELNDPIDQRARFEEQMKLREAGDKEAQRLDEDYLSAMEYGMPPAAGFGMSERFFAVIMDKPVRETVIFPLLRPRNDAKFFD